MLLQHIRAMLKILKGDQLAPRAPAIAPGPSPPTHGNLLNYHLLHVPMFCVQVRCLSQGQRQNVENTALVVTSSCLPRMPINYTIDCSY